MDKKALVTKTNLRDQKIMKVVPFLPKNHLNIFGVSYFRLLAGWTPNAHKEGHTVLGPSEEFSKKPMYYVL